MCGLVGMAGDIRANDTKALTDLLMFDYVRGKHSTGVAGVSSSANTVDIIKDATDPITLAEGYKAYSSVVSTSKKVLIGHNRHATIGKVNRVNAHPFHHGSIVGAHNGTIDFNCRKNLVQDIQGETDSEQLFATIAKRGIMETIPSVSGAWALTWFDQSDNSINLLRNNQRPLFYALSENAKMLYWASESWMLLVALSRNDIKHRPIVEVPVDQVLSWVVPSSFSQSFAETPAYTKLEGKKAENFQYANHYHANSSGNNGNKGSGSNYWDLPDREKAFRTKFHVNNGITNIPEKEQAQLDLYWEVYSTGWIDGQCSTPVVDNPWPTQLITYRGLRQAWEEGFKDGRKSFNELPPAGKMARIRDKHQGKVGPDETVKKSLTDKLKNLTGTPTLLPHHGSSFSNNGKTRVGPRQTRIDAARFRELTDLECGWCNDPVTFEDSGFFGTCLGEDIYVCGECAKDKSQLIGIEE